jgi:hypothetical protein
MADNGISTLEFKADRQLAKLELAAAKRAADGRRSNLDITQLPTVYATNDNLTADAVDNPNNGGLVLGRPWVLSSTSITAFVNGWNTITNALEPDTAPYPGLSAVGAGWTVTGPNGFTATVISSVNAGPNWYIVVDASLADFTDANVGNYTFTAP